MIEPLGWESLGGFLEEVTVDQEKERVDRVFRQGEQCVGRVHINLNKINFIERELVSRLVVSDSL